MIYALVNHPVQDFDAWKPFFDNDQPRARAAGLNLIKLFRGLENPNSVSLLFSAASQEVFDAFVHDPRLGEIMQKAGVLAPPTIEFFTEAP